MHLTVDTSACYTTQAGVARYVSGLLRGLRLVGLPGLRVSLSAWPVANFGYRQPTRGLKTFYREFIWAPWVAPGGLRKLQPDVYHSTALPLVKPPSPIRHVATLHDLAVIRHPQRFRTWQRLAARRLLGRLANVDCVVCISRFTADEGIALLGLDPRRIEVVHNGCDWVEERPEATRPAFPVPSEFFLFVGSLEPGKNLPLLAEVYRRASSEGHALPPLLIVGARWEGVSREDPPPNGWHYLGRQTDSVLVYLYQRALALVFPSKYEGFGLPVAEAMSLGCPVVCSPVASLPEVAGDAAMLVPPTADAYWEGLRQLASDEPLRQELTRRGSAWVQRFSWVACARGTHCAYEKATK